MRNVWEQWDLQEDRRIRNAYFVVLNNLYLMVESGALHLTISIANDLRVLIGKVWDNDDPMIDYWLTECTKLPNWNNV